MIHRSNRWDEAQIPPRGISHGAYRPAYSYRRLPWAIFRHLEARAMRWWDRLAARLTAAFLAVGEREAVQVAWATALVAVAALYVLGRLAQAWGWL